MTSPSSRAPAYAWVAVAILGLLIYGLGRGLSDTSTMPILCQIVSPECRATGYDFLNLFSSFVGGALREGRWTCQGAPSFRPSGWWSPAGRCRH